MFLLQQQGKVYKYNVSKLDWKRKNFLKFGNVGFMTLKTRSIRIVELKCVVSLIGRFFKKNLYKRCKL
jgi:hypothetical protein